MSYLENGEHGKILRLDILGKGMCGRWNESIIESASGPHVWYLTVTIGKKKRADQLHQLFVLFIFLCILNTDLGMKSKTMEGTIVSLPKQPISFDYTLILKINKSNSFVSLIHLLISHYFISELSWMRINFYCAFSWPGKRISSCMKFLLFFSKVLTHLLLITLSTLESLKEGRNVTEQVLGVQQIELWVIVSSLGKKGADFSSKKCIF